MQAVRREIRRFEPICKCHEFKCRQTAGRLAFERPFIRRGLSDFGHSIAKRRTNAVKPFGGGLCAKLGTTRKRKYQLTQTPDFLQAFRSNFPVIKNQIGAIKLREQFHRQRAWAW